MTLIKDGNMVIYDA